MADKKISQLTDGTSLQSGDSLVIARSGDNFKVDPTQFGSSIDVTGTVTADGLTVEGTASNTLRIAFDQTRYYDIYRDNTSNGELTFYGSQTGFVGYVFGGIDGNRLNIASNGDISFYEDTGTTPKFFWDASAESLGIGTGTGTPDDILHVRDDFTSAGITIERGGNNLAKYRLAASADVFSITDTRQSEERLRIDSSGNVGIGTSSPEATLNAVSFSASATTYPIRITNPASPSADVGVALEFGLVTSNDSRGSIGCHWTGASNSDGTYLSFAPNDGSTGNVERMRIDSSGNVGIGTTSPGATLDVAGDIEVNSTFALNGEETSTSTTSATQIASFAVATYGGAKFVVTAHDTVAGERYIVEILVTHDGTTAFSTEYAQVATSTALATYTVDINSGNVRLLATAASSNATNYRVVETLIDA